MEWNKLDQGNYVWDFSENFKTDLIIYFWIPSLIFEISVKIWTFLHVEHPWTSDKMNLTDQIKEQFKSIFFADKKETHFFHFFSTVIQFSNLKIWEFRSIYLLFVIFYGFVLLEGILVFEKKKRLGVYFCNNFF